MNKTLALVAYDLKFSAREFRPLRFIAIAVAVIIFMWSYSVRFHPLFYAFVLGFLSLEGLYMNAFFRLPNELERMMLFPISWHRIIIAKAISTLVLTAPFLLLSGVLISYAAVGLPPLRILWDGLLLFLSASFSMVSLGQILSIQYPRRKLFFNFDEAPYFLFQLVALAISCLPYLVLKVGFESDIACLLFAVLSGVVWYFVVVPRLANQMQREQDKVLERSYDLAPIL
jgi:hypothetical protein